MLHYMPPAKFPLLQMVTIMDEPDDGDDVISSVDVFQHAPFLTAAINTESECFLELDALTRLTVLCLINNWVDVHRQLTVVASILTHCSLSFRALDIPRSVLHTPPRVEPHCARTTTV